ncbi:SPOR domain-containing protein [Phaeobacter sp. 11ANDIMAR09]|uniref:SPOR domain-containing protein n=1 Tax=Phaeobacter sp. 11ANDIMAR09 TaxID=1225647 RepID=UPI0006C8DE33|nr:SPOR domain-containing protein [Phaeobacter sp. 11ANDIMAR09]KPD10481.1 sporulation domain-containing protein [Phaeobacter sp. 11ANDIMAR09]
MTSPMPTWKLKPGLALALLSALTLSACEEGANLGFLKPKPADSAVTASSRTQLVERDVEAPEVFQVNEAGLWDGRPSLGGVWVAHPDATDPERVIIRNNSNGKFVIGALFRREREIPGPRLQVSSDAAAALGMLAGAPVELNVTALRREAKPQPEEGLSEARLEDSPLDEAATAALGGEAIEATPLDPIAGAAAAIDAAAAPSSQPSSPQAPVAPAPRVSSLEKPFIQIGIFSVESNAKNTAAQMRNAGLIPTVLAQTGNGKPFWRVVVGPAQSKVERSQLLKKIKETGFTDAYAVTN